jgi:TolA-binding protein
VIADDDDKNDGLDLNATAVVRVMRDRPIEGRPPIARAQSFRALGARMQVMRARAARARKRNLALAAAGCAVVAVGAIGLSLRPRLDEAQASARPLTYTISGGAPVPGGYIEPAPAAAAPTLSFSDGTRIQMAPESRGRVVETWRHGGRIALEDGRAHVDVAHRPSARWVFEAGPFLINVKGTAFSFGWSGRDARFDVQMESGVVSVTGPVSGGEIVLRAGQKLAIGLRDQPAAPPSGSVPARDEAPPPASAAPPPAGGSAGHWSPERWGTRLAEGRADLIVADARRIGLARVLERSNSEELAALANAARYQHDDALARRVLLTQRRRFPSSSRASEASFLLGRLDDESGGDIGGALRWYDRYLAEAPGGAYVSEALGRKMMALQRSKRHEQAAEIAADYLRRFPAGTYAHAARALVRSP